MAGGFATTLHGDVRATVDVDLILDLAMQRKASGPKDLPDIEQLVKSRRMENPPNQN